MAYVKSYGRKCNYFGCSNAATLVVCNRYNAECNHYCQRHRRYAESLAASMNEQELAEGREA